jgi:hypothetical protein
VKVGDTWVEAERMGILSNAQDSDGVTMSTIEDTRLILIAGKPLNEGIVQYGPFVMNTEQEIDEAINDFRGGRLA